MHPFFIHRVRLSLYVLAWLFAGVGLAELLRLVAPQPARFAHAFAVPLALVLGFAVLAAWWVCRANPLAGGRVGSAMLTQLGTAAQVAGMWTGVCAAWGVGLAQLLAKPEAHAVLRTEWPLLFGLGLFAYLLSAIVHYLVLGLEASHESQHRLLESEVTAREAELRALRAQLNPHFLFNSLNSINALVGSDPEGARRMCERLGDFLRRTLALGAQDDVALGEELELVDRYLGIEHVRFGDRLRSERRLEPGVEACRVPPLLLQPLVENAVKHGVSGCVDGGTIRITARRVDGALVVEVENPVDADAPARIGAGIGLENVRRRLDAFGASGARLEAERGDTIFRVRLVLPAFAAERRRRVSEASPFAGHRWWTTRSRRARCCASTWPRTRASSVVGECANGFEAVKAVSRAEARPRLPRRADAEAGRLRGARAARAAARGGLRAPRTTSYALKGVRGARRGLPAEALRARAARRGARAGARETAARRPVGGRCRGRRRRPGAADGRAAGRPARPSGSWSATARRCT